MAEEDELREGFDLADNIWKMHADPLSSHQETPPLQRGGESIEELRTSALASQRQESKCNASAATGDPSLRQSKAYTET